MGLVVRRATREDIVAFSNIATVPTVRARVGDLDGKIIAIGGLLRADGRWFAFLDLTDEARRYKMTLMRTAKRMLAEAREQGVRFIYAERDENEPGAAAWLQSLGFEIDPRSEYFYRWKA
jgi:hypothetical protein